MIRKHHNYHLFKTRCRKLYRFKSAHDESDVGLSTVQRRLLDEYVLAEPTLEVVFYITIFSLKTSWPSSAEHRVSDHYFLCRNGRWAIVGLTTCFRPLFSTPKPTLGHRRHDVMF